MGSSMRQRGCMTWAVWGCFGLFLIAETTSVESFLSVVPNGLATRDTAAVAFHAATSTSFNNNDTMASSADLTTALMRSLELTSIVVSNILMPSLLSFLTQGIPENATAFFDGTSLENKTNAQWICQGLEAMGATYCKFGQALATRPDIIPPPLADALLKLQDDMEPFDTQQAKQIIQSELTQTRLISDQQIKQFLSSLSEAPVASATIGVVYKGYIDGYGPVAVKVKRPGIQTMVQQDAALLKVGAQWVQAIPSINGQPLVQAKVTQAVDEFMQRIFEELDYQNEANNLQTFSALYSHRRPAASPGDVRVVVPELVPDWSTSQILVMEWIDCEKLQISVDSTAQQSRNSGKSNVETQLQLVQEGISCTLSQLLETGVLHADPHLGNLVVVRRINDKKEETVQLGYLDFGLVAQVPPQVRDGLTCAVVQLVFSRDMQAVARLFGELQLLPESVIQDPIECQALTQALEEIASQVLVYPDDNGGDRVPALRFDNLLSALLGLVTRFEVTLPPYFLNNARALATLEGIARRLEPSFNVLEVVYPFVLDRLLRNPSMSPVVQQTILQLVRSPESNRIDRHRIRQLVEEVARLTGNRKRKVVADAMSTAGGRQISRALLREYVQEKKQNASPLSKKRPSERSSILRL